MVKKCNQSDVAKHLDLTQGHVSKLIKDGVLPSVKHRAGYDLDLYRVAYIRYLRGLAGGQVKKVDGDRSEGDYARLLEMEKYREKKRENDLAEGLVAPVELLTAALEKGAAQIIPVLESLPLIMKRNWPEITGDQITLVKKSIAECRNTIAEMTIEIND